MRRAAVTAAALALAALVAGASGLGNVQEDLFIYRAGAGLPHAGSSPYDTAALRAAVAAQFPGSPHLIANCGFFLTPQAVALLQPLAGLPWPAARAAWVALSVGLLLAGLWALPPGRWRVGLLLAAAADPVLAVVLSIGQTTAALGGLLLLGFAALRAGRPLLGALAWSALFVKPHLALPLLPLAYLLGGRRAFAAVVGFVVVGDLGGVLLAPDPRALPGEYLRHLAGGHRAVVYNQVAYNPSITSWNSALLAAGGPLVELGVGGMLAGYAVAAGVVFLRCRGERPDPAWLLAAAVGAAPVFCQALGYESLLLVALLPLLAERGPTLPPGRLALFAALWLAKSLPVDWANALAAAAGGRLGQLVVAHGSFAALGLWLWVLTLPPRAGRVAGASAG